ncbi:MAG: ferrous iron transport protein B [Campylobacterota bacterium]|nr:ferrous iron transport protein B [Campylobacterota bacterium]
MKKSERVRVAVAGQPNSGKSTIFNMLTGARQYVANYPGVTVEKKTGYYSFKGLKIELIDLPGTYSLTSYSLEERIARDILLHEKPAMVVDVVDASNLERHLYLAFQLAEMGIPLIIDLNMVDMANGRGFKIDTAKLSQQLGVPVVPTVANKGKGKKELKEAISDIYKKSEIAPFRVDYGEKLEPILGRLERQLSQDLALVESYPIRWLVVKLMENDSEAQSLIQEHAKDSKGILEVVAHERNEFSSQYGESPEKFIANYRYQIAEKIVKACVKQEKIAKTFTDRVDRIVCHRIFGPIILLGVIYLMWWLSIVQGYAITNYTYPYLAAFRDFLISLFPGPGFVLDSFLHALPVWVIQGIVAVINYVPIFFILFLLIAILEDTGYIARMAFILDRIFKYFGLHGKSILPLVLGGIYMGGCAIPGVMACRGIKDEKARMTTIMITPLMNCMAKIPLYVLLIGIFFAAHKGTIMFFIATITIIIALSVAKILSITIFRHRMSAPFIMEMPAYHLPTIQGVLHRCMERLWLFFKKIITIVVIVTAIVFLFTHLPGLSKERKTYYSKQANQTEKFFLKKIENTPYASLLTGPKFMEFAQYWDNYKAARMGAKGKKAAKAVDKRFRKKNFEFFKVVKRGRYELDGKKIKDKNAMMVHGAYKKTDKVRKRLRKKIKEEVIIGSILGQVGRSMEPVTKYAGFNWRINIALISAFAAKENCVATIGSLYQVPMGGEETLETTMKKKEKGWTPLHALAIILFMAMYPPCIPTFVMMKLETGSWKWMLFGITYPIILGSVIAVLVFSGGNLLGLTGLQTMIVFYALAVVFMILMGFIKFKPESLIEGR